ncbi:Frizzled-1 [Orchesella cincta]|uniref:Frizzled-1 n=1 Tax=Orchesella cincta TaxID=48709 RepID=A0A1D2MGQ9_ORCCI|nr:Frizzled-1 [Orchesella cincta]
MTSETMTSRRNMCLIWRWLFWVVMIIVHVSNGGLTSASAISSPVTGRASDIDFVHHDHHLASSKTHGRCELITIPLCKDMPYNETFLPNLLGHTTQEEAGYDVHTYYALVKLGCSPALEIFLCSVYAPWCNNLHIALQPCRALCETARLGCEHLMKSFGFSWPENLNCSRYPADTEMCVPGKNHTVGSPWNISSTGYSLMSGTTITTAKPVIELSTELACPSDWIAPEHSIGNQLNDCGPPCSIFTDQQKYVAAVVIGIFAASTLVSSLFTIITAILDSSRFSYPERAIVHLAVCYAALAICYLIGAIWGTEISCENKFIVYGPGSASCTLLFMFTYFFTFASHIWWVLLSLTWYLSAGLKWGGEAIATYSLYFHLTAWGVSAFLTMATVALGYVEGDPLAGPCALGIQRSPQLLYFMMIPLVVLVCIGMFFFSLGFLALFRIRQEIKRSSTVTSAADKISTGGQRSLLWDQHQDLNNAVVRAGAARLELLMWRIGIFSVLYIVPAAVFIGSLYFIATPLSPSGVLPPIIGSQRRSNQMLFVALLVRYIANLAFGSALVVWVWSRKTFMTWKRVFCGHEMK